MTRAPSHTLEAVATFSGVSIGSVRVIAELAVVSVDTDAERGRRQVQRLKTRKTLAVIGWSGDV